MPEFVMEGRDECAREESEFVLGFIEALFFTETSPAWDSSEWFSDECREAQEDGTADGQLPGDVGYSDIHPDSLAAIRADCETWQEENKALLSLAYSTGYDATQAGRDYLYSRQGHGVGFWDREALQVDVYRLADGTLTLDAESEHTGCAGTIGEMLHTACQYREVSPFFGNHVVHGDAPFVHVDL